MLEAKLFWSGLGFYPFLR